MKGGTHKRMCECLWDEPQHNKVLQLCEYHLNYARENYVQATGTLFKVDDNGKPVDYEMIPYPPVIAPPGIH